MRAKARRLAGKHLQDLHGCHLQDEFICCLINSPMFPGTPMQNSQIQWEERADGACQLPIDCCDFCAN